MSALSFLSYSHLSGEYKAVVSLKGVQRNAEYAICRQ